MLSHVLFVASGKEVDVLLLFPRGPDEVTVGREALLAAVLPPVTLFKHRLHDREIVSWSHPELLGQVNLAILLT